MKIVEIVSVFVLIATFSGCVSSLTCYIGVLSGNQVENGTFATQECSKDQVCMTRIERNHGVMNVLKMCKEKQPCGTQQEQNPMQCYQSRFQPAAVRVCRYCCDTDLCNDQRDIPDPRK